MAESYRGRGENIDFDFSNCMFILCLYLPDCLFLSPPPPGGGERGELPDFYFCDNNG